MVAAYRCAHVCVRAAEQKKEERKWNFMSLAQNSKLRLSKKLFIGSTLCHVKYK